MRTALLFFAVALSLHAAPPNVVVFLADDAGWGDYSANGNQTVHTPNIDSLARDGVTVDRFFVCPVCSPTRAEFLTGRYHRRGGVYGVSTGQERLSPEERTIADAFKASGYATGAFGKWHNGSQWPYHPMARGFDEYYGHTSGHWGEYFDPPLEHNGQPVREQGFIVDLCTNKALDFIQRSKDKPFLCYIPFTTPHSPYAVPAKYWERFKDKPVAQQATLADKEVTDETRCVLAMLENQDDNVGRVLSLLDQLKLSENTIVLYFSDNGPNGHRWTGGMKGTKGTTDEGGVRSTCFMRWPAKLPKGTTMMGIAGAIDLLPTLTAMAGVPRVGDKPLDGMDLQAQLMGNATPPPRRIFTTWGGAVSVRTQTHRLDREGKLYNMTTDPGQSADISAASPALASELRSAVAQWTSEVIGEAPPKKGKGKAKGEGNAVDPRPIDLGYREFPRTWLPARDASSRGNIKRSSSAPNCSYYVNWTSKDDAILWSVDVHLEGDYEAEVLYTCPEADAGSTVELSLNGSAVSTKVSPGWDPPLYTNQDTVHRHAAESQMKPFKALKLGTLHLMPGKGELTLRATEMAGKSVMDVRALTLTLKP